MWYQAPKSRILCGPPLLTLNTFKKSSPLDGRTFIEQDSRYPCSTYHFIDYFALFYRIIIIREITLYYLLELLPPDSRPFHSSIVFCLVTAVAEFVDASISWLRSRTAWSFHPRSSLLCSELCPVVNIADFWWQTGTNITYKISDALLKSF